MADIIVCPGRRGRLSALSVFLCKSVFYGVFVWARRALNSQKWRFPARAVTADSIVDVRLSAGADQLGSAGEPAGVCFEGSAENAEMRCQSAAGEVGYKGCTVDGDCLNPECVGRARAHSIQRI